MMKFLRIFFALSTVAGSAILVAQYSSYRPELNTPVSSDRPQNTIAVIAVSYGNYIGFEWVFPQYSDPLVLIEPVGGFEFAESSNQPAFDEDTFSNPIISPPHPQFNQLISEAVSTKRVPRRAKSASFTDMKSVVDNPPFDARFNVLTGLIYAEEYVLGGGLGPIYAEEYFSRFDKNKDGKWTKDEFADRNNWRWRKLIALGMVKDGSVTLARFRPHFRPFWDYCLREGR